MRCVSGCWLAAIAGLMIALLAGPARGQSREILAHGNSSRMWVGRWEAATTPAGEVEQTDLMVRAAGPGEKWKQLATVPSRALALASRDGQAVVLLGDGEWTSIWAPDGASTGDPLPGGAQIRALGDGGQTLWAVGAVPGGWAAALAQSHKPNPSPSDQNQSEPATTAPTTAPAVAASSATTVLATQPIGPIRDVVFRQTAGVWVPVAPVPLSDDNHEGGQMAITVVGPAVMVASASVEGTIDVSRWTATSGWSKTYRLSLLDHQPAVDFNWVVANDSAELWATDGRTIGRLFLDPLQSESSVALKWNGPTTPVGLPAIAVAGGYIRLVGLHEGRLYEQRYETNGRPVGKAAALALPVDVGNSPLQQYIDYGLLAALLLSTIATIYRRSISPATDGEWTPPPPAPLLVRLGAGIIDLIPVLVTVAVVSIHTDATRNALDRLQDLPALIATGSSIAFYILHTTVLELLTRRSAGKWVFGLRAVSIDGKRATAVQILLRNGLRVIDLLVFPLVIVLISPLRQRSADIAAGTMVVRETPVKADTNESEAASVNTLEES